MYRTYGNEECERKGISEGKGTGECEREGRDEVKIEGNGKDEGPCLRTGIKVSHLSHQEHRQRVSGQKQGL